MKEEENKKGKGKEEPATELMKKVAEKTPSKRKILKDFSPAEAKEIMENVEAKKKKPMTKEQKELRAMVVRVKHIVKRMEAGNNSKIIIFPSYSSNPATALKWYKMADFSALYYAYRMADRMGRDPELRNDDDRFAQMHKISSIRNIENFVEQAMKLGEFAEHEVTLDDIHILHLKKSLTDEEVALLRRTGKLRRETMHNVLKPKKASPGMYLEILMLTRMINKVANGLRNSFRINIGNRMVLLATNMLEVYFDFADGAESVEVTKTKMRKLALRIRAGVAILGDNEVIQPTKACAIGETIVKIERLMNELK